MTSIKNDRPSLRERVIEVGLSDVYEFIELTGESGQTLRNWFANPKKQQAFECMLAGAVTLRNQATNTPRSYWQYHAQRLRQRYSQDRYDLFESKILDLAKQCIEDYPQTFTPETVSVPGSPRHILALSESQ